MPIDKVVVIGGGVSGLASALALEGIAREVIVLERDAAPPDIRPEQAFEHWQRPGVPQFRHAHILLARLQTLLRDDYPELHARLLAAGLELSELREVLPPAQAAHYEEAPGDRDLIHLWGRRPTFEYVIRRYAEERPHVRFEHGVRVERLLTELDGDCVRVAGVGLSRGPARFELRADLVIDASGKRTQSPEQLKALGVRVATRVHETNRVYVCRHYQLLDPSDAPPRTGTGADHDCFGYAAFYAEHGHYALSLSCPTEEEAFAARMKRSEGFDGICKELPALAQWLRRSRPTTKVLGAGNFRNRWTRYGVRGGRKLAGFFAVGDSQLETNPMYGRGCASAFVQAKILRAVLLDVSEPVARGREYAARVQKAMQPHFDFCVGADRMMESRGRLSRGQAIAPIDRLIKHAYEEAFLPAMEASALVAREMVKAMQMRELSGMRTRLWVLAQLLLTWTRRRFDRERRPSLPAPPLRLALLRSPGRAQEAHAIEASVRTSAAPQASEVGSGASAGAG